MWDPVRSLRVVVAACILAAGGAPFAQEPDPVEAAAEALGASELASLRFTAFGAAFSVGQNPSPGEPWPRVTVKSYEVAIHYDTAAMRVEMVRTQGAIPPRGGGRPFTGDQTLVQVVSGDAAWDVPQPPPAPGQRGGPPPSPEAENARADDQTPDVPEAALELPPQAQPSAAAERNQQIWLTPHGFLKAAMANDATVSRVPGGTEVTFTVGGKYRFTGLIDAKNHVAHVRSWLDNPVLGDMPIEVLYRDYESFGGTAFPTHIIQSQGGYPSLELWVYAVEPHAAVEIAAPESIRGASVPPVTVEIEEIAEGVHYITGGSHHSVAIEMTDHVVVVEAPLDEARSRAVIARLRESVPTRPIRFVINTHHHFDHAGGLRTYASEGAAIVTHEVNRAFYETAWAAPRTLAPDGLSQSGRSASFETFTDRHVLTDGRRTIEIHRIANSPHHDGFAMVYLPAEKLLIEADAYTPIPEAPLPPPPATPGPPGPPPAPPSNPTAINLYENVRRLGLDVERIAALHGPRLATLDDLAKAAGR